MNCYNCGVILNRKNRSVEHIINASIGGFKKGYNLLCQDCNKEFGRTIDKELGRQLGAFGRLLNIPLDRGEHARNTSIIIPGGKEYLRAVAKICLNYYLSKGYPKQYCEQVKTFVKGDSSENIVHYYFQELYIPEENEVSHIIHLHGNKELGILYAYIELFNMQNFIIIFHMDYTGEDIHVTYCRDVVKNKELVKDIELGLNRRDLEGLKDASDAMRDKLGVRLERLKEIIKGQQLSVDL